MGSSKGRWWIGAGIDPRAVFALSLGHSFRHDGNEERGEESMTSRADIERILSNAYDARKRGDLDGICRLFAPHARFQMAGSNASPVASKVVGTEQCRPLLAGMIK